MKPHVVWFLVAVLSLPASQCVNYVHDELLWTKQSWNEHKLPFPWKFFSKREPAVARLLESDEFVANSLNGPLGDIKAEVEQDIKRGVDLQPSRFDVSLLNEEASLDAAAGVAQCKVCMAAATALWRGLTAWVDTHEAVPSKKRIAEYAMELCELEVPNEVLREWVVLRAKVQPSQTTPFFIEGNQEFYMLSQRQKQHATPSEIAAVQLACKRLIKDDTAAAPKSELVRLLSGMLHKYYDHLEQRLGKARSTGGAVEAVDDGPHYEQECVDRHPQCRKWADKGECKKNPTYMIGDERKYIGQCKRACGACKPALESKPDWAEADREFMASLSTDYLSVLQSKACASGAPCAGAAGAGVEQLLALAGGGGKKDGEGKGSLGGFVSGPVGAGQEGEAKQAYVDPSRIQNSRVIATRPGSQAFVQHIPPKKASPRPPGKLPTAAAQSLWKELGGLCLYSSAGWWTYEVCFADSISQFHMNDAQQVDWVISLGRLESLDWEVHNTTSAGLYPEGTQVPYLSQLYTNGNNCELTADDDGGEETADTPVRGDSAGGAEGDEEDEYEDDEGDDEGVSGDNEPQQQQGVQQGGAQRRRGLHAAGEEGSTGAKDVPMIKRASELRVMCSPDLESHIYVLEPRQCRYIVELYLPSLCRLEGFAPPDHDLPSTGVPEVL